MRNARFALCTTVDSRLGIVAKQIVHAGVVACLISFASTAHSAADLDSDAYQDMRKLAGLSMQELLHAKIELPSKREEPAFRSPVPSSVLTREEILASGALNIPEALRLMPGIIVREQSAGNFDVHVRGFDYVPPGSIFTFAQNSLTLVMIDGRIAYDYQVGGTFWETFPVSINDIEQIELVRGPAAALYGPNAVTGVINVVTRRQADDGLAADVRSEGGYPAMGIGEGWVGYRWDDKISIGGSVNAHRRSRHRAEYYTFSPLDTSGNLVGPRYVHDPDDIVSTFPGGPLVDADGKYPHPKRSANNFAVNAFAELDPTENLSLDLMGGYQDSTVQKIFQDTSATPFTTSTSKSGYFNFKGAYRNFKLASGITWGERGTKGEELFDYDFMHFNVDLSYEAIWKGLRIRPELSYWRAENDGTFLGDRSRHLESVSGSLQLDYQIGDVRLLGAVRFDGYNTPDTVSVSYNAAATWQITEDWLLRASGGSAVRAPFFQHVYSSSFFPNSTPGVPDLMAVGNDDLDLLRISSVDVGTRVRVSDALSFELEGFASWGKNWVDIRRDPAESVPDQLEFFRFENLPIKARQLGMTVSLVWLPCKGVSVRPFVTLQHTRLKKYAPDARMPNDFDRRRHRNTPTWYGGAVFLWQPLPKLTVNVSPYFYSKQTLEHSVVGPVDTDKIDLKVVLNAKVSYAVAEGFSVFVNARNMAMDDREYGFADQIRSTYSMGVRFQR